MDYRNFFLETFGQYCSKINFARNNDPGLEFKHYVKLITEREACYILSSDIYAEGSSTIETQVIIDTISKCLAIGDVQILVDGRIPDPPLSIPTVNICLNGEVKNVPITELVKLLNPNSHQQVYEVLNEDVNKLIITFKCRPEHLMSYLRRIMVTLKMTFQPTILRETSRGNDPITFTAIYPIGVRMRDCTRINEMFDEKYPGLNIRIPYNLGIQTLRLPYGGSNLRALVNPYDGTKYATNINTSSRLDGFLAQVVDRYRICDPNMIVNQDVFNIQCELIDSAPDELKECMFELAQSQNDNIKCGLNNDLFMAQFSTLEHLSPELIPRAVELFKMQNKLL